MATQSGGHRKTLDRELGLTAVLAISMGAMLGSGIFVLPGLAIGKVGSALFLAYLLSGLVVLPAALCKCEMATAMPDSGGTYLYVDRSMGPLAGTVVGIGTWFSLVFKSAFALIGLGAYCGLLFHLEDPIPLALGLCTGLIALNLVGVKKSTGAQTILVGVSLVGLVVFSALLLPELQAYRFSSMVVDLEAQSLIATAGFVFVSFAGVTKICSIAEEIKDPDRNLPRSILIALGTICVVYCVISLVLAGVVDLSFFEDPVAQVTPLASVAGAVLGPTALVVLSILAILTLSSMANAGLLTSSRYPLAMARDNLLPDVFASIGARFGTPAPAILLTGGVMLTLISLVPVIELAKLASAFQLLVFCLVNLTVILVRESGARWYRPSFRVPLYPLTPILGIVGTLVLLSSMGRVAIIGAGGIIATGLIWYFLYARRRVDRHGAVTRLYGERRRLTQRNPRPLPESGVTVAIFQDDADLETLIPLGAMLADPGCEIQVLRIEEVSNQMALALVPDDDPRTLDIRAHVVRTAAHLGEVVAFENVVTHNAKHALYERAVGERTNWVLMRWVPRSAWRWFVTDPVAWFIHHPPSNLLLFKDAPGADASGEPDLSRFKRILVFAEAGPHDSLVVHVADRLAQTSGGQLTFVYLHLPDAPDDALQASRDYHTVISELSSQAVGPPLLERSDDDIATLLRLSADYDLLVLGAPPQSEVRGALRGSFEDRITEHAPCAVLRVKALRYAPHSSLSRPTEPRQGKSPPSARLAWVQPSLNELLNDVYVGVTARNQADLFARISERFDAHLGRPLDPPLHEALAARERKQPTTLGEGVAFPHVSLSELKQTHLELWLLKEPVDFGSREAGPVDLVFVILGPPGDRRTHLHTLASISKLALRPGFLDQLRAVEDEDQTRALIAGAEQSSV